ncbi:hypothetical protein AA13595_0505 [Gluconacetobacter johannae DSM 13595]|uniref:Uncharacterized protein n=1 Tax=Gluconacetobacter johannae TaxID=112140 RepID=A0A7W4J5X8_9PROT|nr:hypothetical protein [Gluconacetobacter johannae]MBB2175315.1 hypothetical protein [Gluconacetobacter johannae]GBQ81044.1 hypothetical protein AA13595_0505 [Gluconacetobacter johannae DSM 13595]
MSHIQLRHDQGVRRCAASAGYARVVPSGGGPAGTKMWDRAWGVAVLAGVAWLARSAWAGGVTLRDLSDAAGCLFAF